jgi:hypothetical protein
MVRDIGVIMSNLAEAQLWAEREKLVFTDEERARVAAFKIPGEGPLRFGPRMYPRRPNVNVREWYADHAAKLKSLERAAW